MVSELVFAQPDDPLVMGTARQMLSATAGWDAPALAPRGDVKPGVDQSGGVDDVLAVPDVTIRGDADSEDDSEVIAKQEQGEKIVEGPPDNGPEAGSVDVENLPKGSDAVGLRVAKDFQ